MEEKTQRDFAELKLPPPKYKWGEIKDEEIKIIELASGKKFEYIEVDGMKISISSIASGLMPDARVNIPRLRQMTARNDDILICAYAKAGTHWIWEITKMLLKGEAKYEQLHKVSSMLELNTPEQLEEMTPPRVFNTHLRFHQIPKQMVDKKCKMIFMQRNVKDVIVSFLHHVKVFDSDRASITFAEYLTEWKSGLRYDTWYDYTIDWEKALESHPDLNVIFMYYEDIKKDPVKEISRLAEFLDVKSDQLLVNKIADKCTFQNMKEAEKPGFHGDKESKGMAKALYRKGQVGDWKNWFTVALNEQFDSEYEETMKDSKFKYTYTLN